MKTKTNTPSELFLFLLIQFNSIPPISFQVLKKLYQNSRRQSLCISSKHRIQFHVCYKLTIGVYNGNSERPLTTAVL